MTKVAVLVLLEVRMQHRLSGHCMSGGSIRSCSPCFAGSSYATKLREFSGTVVPLLQSLFCWKFVCNNAQRLSVRGK